jgi:hypothetical protein
VESKDDIRKRLGRSTDTADAVAMACWHNPGMAKDPPELGATRKPRTANYTSAVSWR